MGSRLTLVPLLLLGLSACAGPIETRVVSCGAGVPEAASILAEAPPNSEVAASAHKLVTGRLAERGFGQSPAGALQLHIAFAERDAAIAVRTRSGDQWADVSAAKPKKPLQSCADREMRLTVTLTRIADGTELYRGSAAEYHCKAQAANVLPSLVDAALADLAGPKGAYRTMRQGLE